LGLVLLVALTALAAFAALALATRARLGGRAETLVAASLLWEALLMAPIYLFGFAGRLTALSAALGAALASGAALLLASRGVGLRALLGDTVGAARGLLRLPADAVALTFRARSLVLVGVVFAIGLVAYLAVNAYLAAPLPMWDALWYHEPMVGFTIQNHGFAIADVPYSGLHKANAYPRLGEMTQLWLVLFTDRRYADFANLLFAPALAAAVYVLARRHAGPVISIGWGVAVLVMPACANLLQQTMIDPLSAAMLLGGILFATRDPLRLRDAWLAALGLALAVGSKVLSLAPAAVAGVIAAVLVIRAHPGRRRAAVATVAGGFALVALMAASIYLRNYLVFHNPFWPDMRVEIPALGIHWPGESEWGAPAPGHSVNMNESVVELVGQTLALPGSVKSISFGAVADYGIGMAWIAFPLGAIAFVACLVAALRRRRRRNDDGQRPPLAIALILAVMVIASPALWAPRYHIAAVGLVAALVAWLTARPSLERLGESAVAAVLVTSMMMFAWTPEPRYWLTPAQLLAEARMPFPERELTRPGKSATSLATGLARERELGPGSLLVFNERFGAFASLFWNLHYGNRVMYLPGGPDFLERAARAGATWIFVGDHDLLAVKAGALGSGWQDVGVLNPLNGGHAYRRVAVTGGQR
jgi:hypothetical protein